ncbi:MAG: potassium transporter Trk [Synergistaceae bacterium]|nr:potassium transporter Trk [Synergistaceae bacterium]
MAFRTYTSLATERKIVIGFLALIGTGTVAILLLNANSRPLTFVDALFTATSAVCVTGLTVVDTGKDLTTASQLVLLLLIQLGGLGVMTATTALSLLMRERIGLRQRMFFAGGFGLDSPSGVIRLLIRILSLTFAIEAIAVFPLYWGFSRAGLSPEQSLYNAVFHSVSAFCNAGFSLFSENLEGFSSGILVPGTVMVLVVLGGLGFIVLSELKETFREPARISVHSRLVLLTTAGLVLFGTALLLLCEWNRSLESMGVGWKIWNALFSSITPRTAGFDTVALSTFSSAGLFVVTLLMIVGASPGSTGGGFKTTTLAVLLVSTWNVLKGRSEVHLWNRRIPIRVIQRAITMIVLYLGILGIGLMTLVLLEPFPFRSLLFETASALGTVGLSLGITSQLSDPGKLVLVLLMFWGRVGIITFLYGLVKREARGKISYPDAEIPVG